MVRLFSTTSLCALPCLLMPLLLLHSSFLRSSVPRETLLQTSALLSYSIAHLAIHAFRRPARYVQASRKGWTTTNANAQFQCGLAFDTTHKKTCEWQLSPPFVAFL